MFKIKTFSPGIFMVCLCLIFVAGCTKDSRGWPYGDAQIWNSSRKPYLAATSISISPNGKLLAVANYGGKLTTYGVATSIPLKTITKYQKPSRILQVKFLDNNTLLLAAGDGKLRAIHPVSGKIKYMISDENLCFMPFSLSKNKKLIASIEADEKIYIWSIKKRKLITSFPGPGQGVQDITFAPNDKSIFTSTNGENQVAQWDIKSGKKIWSRYAETYDISISPNGQYLAMRRDSAIELWDLKKDKLYKRLAPTEFGIGHFRFNFSPDGKLLAGAELGGDVVIWDIATGEEIADFNGPVGDGLDLIFSPDGKKVFAAGYRDGTVRMWYVPSINNHFR